MPVLWTVTSSLTIGPPLVECNLCGMPWPYTANIVKKNNKKKLVTFLMSVLEQRINRLQITVE